LILEYAARLLLKNQVHCTLIPATIAAIVFYRSLGVAAWTTSGDAKSFAPIAFLSALPPPQSRSTSQSALKEQKLVVWYNKNCRCDQSVEAN
jgi:hypothetical protein